MPQVNNSAREQLLKLEKIVKKVIRKSLKNNTLEYTVQISVSSLEPGKLHYTAHISSPAAGVQPVTFGYPNFDMLLAALQEAEKQYNPTEVEIAFHENRMNVYKNKIKQHEKRVEELKNPDQESDELTEVLTELDKKVKEKNETTD